MMMTFCLEENRQSLIASWIPALIEDFSPQQVDLSFTVPRSPLNVSDFNLVPASFLQNNVHQTAETLTFFYPFEAFEISAIDEMFFQWNEEVFPGELNECPLPPDPNFELFVIVASIPIAACACLILLGICQRVFEMREEARLGRRRMHRFGFGLSIFSGSPDIILSPQHRESDSDEGTTVRAIYENDDPLELDAIVPVTTIQVRLEGTDDDSNQRNETWSL